MRPRGVGRLPRAWGRLPRAWGRLPRAWGRLPRAWGRLPRAWGRLPRAWGRLPRAWGRLPRAWGRLPRAWGRLPKAWGTSPQSVGTSPQSVGTSPQSVGTSPQAWGRLPMAWGRLPRRGDVPPEPEISVPRIESPSQRPLPAERPCRCSEDFWVLGLNSKHLRHSNSRIRQVGLVPSGGPPPWPSRQDTASFALPDRSGHRSCRLGRHRRRSLGERGGHGRLRLSAG